jgi:hypothetical protein
LRFNTVRLPTNGNNGPALYWQYWRWQIHWSVDPQVTIQEVTTIGVNSGNRRWNPILATFFPLF